MPNKFCFEFEELPLMVEGGFQCGLINGVADISYDRDGTWSVSAVALEGHRQNYYSAEYREAAAARKEHLPRFQIKNVWLDAGTSIHLMIVDRLETEWRGQVQDAVMDRIAEDREAGRTFRAELRRDDAMMAAV
jgi:hypothetical protein